MIAAAFLRDFVKGVAFDKLAKSVSSFYDRLRNKDEIYQRIKDYRIKNDKLGIDDTVANLAKQYNVPLDQYVSRLSDYLKRDTNYLNAVLAKLKSRLSGEDLGKSEAEIYAQASKADDLVSRLMGYAKAPDTKQRINYLNDKVRGYIGSAYQKAKSIQYRAEKAKDDHPFIYGTFKKVGTHLVNRALQKRGISGGLEQVLGSGRKLRDSASPVLKEYHEIIKSFYGGDLRNGVYA